jgi:hypothetical protein
MIPRAPAVATCSPVVTFKEGSPNRWASGRATGSSRPQARQSMQEVGLLAYLNVIGLICTSKGSWHPLMAPGFGRPEGRSGTGFAGQQWTDNAAGSMIAFQDVKTGPFLRVRNSGPSMDQTVTTGSSFTVWLMF